MALQKQTDDTRWGLYRQNDPTAIPLVNFNTPLCYRWLRHLHTGKAHRRFRSKHLAILQKSVITDALAFAENPFAQARPLPAQVVEPFPSFTSSHATKKNQK